MKIATISSKGQITFPQLLLRELNLKPKHKVLVKREGRTLVIKPIKKSLVEETSGSLRKYISKDKLGKPFSEIREQTIKMAAKEIAEEA